jgi:hypothetical protein
MAIEWCALVDGVKMFPKLPVYLRTHHAAWTRNQRVCEAVAKARPGEEVLSQINEETRRKLLESVATSAAAVTSPAVPPVAPY